MLKKSLYTIIEESSIISDEKDNVIYLIEYIQVIIVIKKIKMKKKSAHEN